MKTHILFYNSETDKQNFELRCGTRPWGILLAISKGSFRITFPALGQSDLISQDEVAYIPPGIEFVREIIAPIDFHQFAFQICDDVVQIGKLPAGKINIPHKQVNAILQSADKISKFPIESEKLSKHILDRFLTDHYLFSSVHASSYLSREILLATSYIQNNLGQQLSVAKIAKELHLSHNGLIFKFKKELNMPPQKYIALFRIKQAKQLLFEGKLTITQIAEYCGYANAYYFSNAFKKIEGVSPSEFRKRCIQ